MSFNPLVANKLKCPVDGSVTDLNINFGNSSEQNSGTGIYGTATQINLAVGGSVVSTITASGISGSLVNLLALSSSVGAGGAATEVMVVTGLLSTDTILSVSQKTKGANSLPLLGFNTQANNALTAVWSADPGAGSVILVAVKR